MIPLLKVDFHCHTVYSADSINIVDQLLKITRERGVDRLVITDHNSIQGALIAQKKDPERVIVGEEIMTQKGELLAAFVKEEIPGGLPPMVAIEKLREQNAFISVSHPFDLRRHGWELEDLKQITPYIDAIEIFNARCLNSKMNRQAQQFAVDHELGGTVGSDAHIPYEIGRAGLYLPLFSNADELRDVIRRGEPQASLSPFWVHFGSGFARIAKKLGGFQIN